MTLNSARPAIWRQTLWLIVLVAFSVVFSLGFACAAPLAAFAAAAALLPSRRSALGLVVATWLTNQVIGYAALGYPWTADSLAWGAALGAAAVLATWAARTAVRHVPNVGEAGTLLAAFAAAFIAYEVTLLAFAVALLGGIEEFAPSIVGQILGINAAAAFGLYVVNLIGASIGFVAGPPRLAARPTG